MRESKNKKKKEKGKKIAFHYLVGRKSKEKEVGGK